MQTARLVTGYEFNSPLFANVSVGDAPALAPLLCSGAPVAQGSQQPLGEVAYNHFVNRRGMAMPSTWAHLINFTRSLADPMDTHISQYETLTVSTRVVASRLETCGGADCWPFADKGARSRSSRGEEADP